MTDSVIEFENVTKAYGDVMAIEGISFSVDEGTTTVLVGPSGCGKTTTMKLVNRLEDATSGTVRFEGTDVQSLDKIELRRNIGYVIQDIGLFDHMTVAENIGTVPRLLDWESDRIAERVDELLELMDLEPDQYRDVYPREMSGGQRQRVGVARALAADPDVMLMDEPFGALDPITREDLQDEFLEIQEQINTTILFVTHDIDEALKMGDRIAIYNAHEVVQYDTPRNILENPVNDFVRDFIGENRGLKKLKVLDVRDVMDTRGTLVGTTLPSLLDNPSRLTGIATSGDGTPLTIEMGQSTETALSLLVESDGDTLLVVDDATVMGTISLTRIKEELGASKEVLYE